MKSAHSLRLVTLVCAAGVVTHAVSLAAATPPAGYNEPRWTANLRSMNTDRAMLTDTARPRSSGSVKWTAGKEPGQSVIDISVSYGGEESTLSWAILFGACDSQSMTLLPVSSFPEIELNSVGTGKVTAILTLDFPTSGNYRVEVYRDRMGSREGIVACGNLKYSR